MRQASGAATWPFVVVLAVGVTLALVVAGLAWRFRDRPGARPLMWTMLGAAFWGTCDVLDTVVAPGARLFWAKVLYLGVGVVVAGWFVFVLEYTGRERHVTRWTLAALAVEPLAVLALVATNGSHGLFWNSIEPAAGASGISVEFGVAFWVHAAYSYILLGTAVVLLGLEVSRRRDLFRDQAAALVVAVTVPWVANAVYLGDVVAVDITPTGFAVSGAALFFATARFELMDVTPVARATVVDNIHAGVVVLDREDRILDVNEAGERILGVEDGESILGRPAPEVLPEYPEVWDRFADVERGHEEVDVEVGADRYVYDVLVSPLTDDRDRTVGRLFLIHDVTEQKRREEELERQNEQLDQFASIVSHDLRNPLTVADGNLDLAIETGDMEYARKARSAHERMRAIIDDVLTLAREGRTVEEGAVEPVDLAELAREAWGNVDTADASLSVGTDLRVGADRDRLSRAFENLYRNAVEHGGEDVTVRVGTLGGAAGPDAESGTTEGADGTDDRQRTTDGGDADPGTGPGTADDLGPGTADGAVGTGGPRGFFVADDGPGIPEDRRERVFEDGYTTGDGGTGLGLSIVRSVVEAHGWEIAAVESESGGARFEVRGVDPAPDPGAGEEGDRNRPVRGAGATD